MIGVYLTVNTLPRPMLMTRRSDHRYHVIYCLVIAILMASCRPAQRPDHDAYFARHIAHARNMQASIIHQKAIPYIDSVYRNFDKPGVGDLAQVYDFKSNYYLYEQANYEKAELYADSLLDLLRPYYGHDRYRERYVMAYIDKGNTLYKQKYYSSAYEWYFLGKNMLSSDDTASCNKYMARLNSSLAQVSYEQGRYKAAIRCYHECLNRIGDHQDRESFKLRQGLLDNIGISYSKLDRPDDAIKYFEKALNVLQAGHEQYPDLKLFINSAIGLVQGNEGDAYLQKKDLDKAERLYRSSIAINSQKDHLIIDARYTKVKLAALYIMANRYPEARTLLDDVRPELDTTYRPEMMRWLMTNAEYYRYAPGGNMTKAFDDLRRYVALNDSAQAEVRVAANANYNDQFALLQRQYELKADEKRDKLNDLIIFSIALIGVLIAAITGSILLKRTLASKPAMARKAADVA